MREQIWGRPRVGCRKKRQKTRERQKMRTPTNLVFASIFTFQGEKEESFLLVCIYEKWLQFSSLLFFLPSFLLLRFQVTLTEKRREKDPTRCGYRQKSSINNSNYKFFQLFLRLKNWPKKSWQIPFHSKKKESAAIRRHLPFSPFASHKRSFFLRTVEERERERSVSDKKLPPTLSPSELSV